MMGSAYEEWQLPTKLGTLVVPKLRNQLVNRWPLPVLGGGDPGQTAAQRVPINHFWTNFLLKGSDREAAEKIAATGIVLCFSKTF